MKTIMMVLCIAMCAGCASVQMTDYVQPRYPYTRTYQTTLPDTITAVKKVLEHSGYPVANTQNPSVYERGQVGDDAVVLLTKIRVIPMVLYSHYSHLNVYVLPLTGRVEVEIRYETMTPVLGIKFRGSRNDALVKKLFHQIEQELNATPVTATP